MPLVNLVDSLANERRAYCLVTILTVDASRSDLNQLMTSPSDTPVLLSSSSQLSKIIEINIRNSIWDNVFLGIVYLDFKKILYIKVIPPPPLSKNIENANHKGKQICVLFWFLYFFSLTWQQGLIFVNWINAVTYSERLNLWNSLLWKIQKLIR